jgi:Delta7-sterol 5-desaturase
MKDFINSHVLQNDVDPTYLFFLRYVLVAGVFYLFYYVFFKDRLAHKKIQKKMPKNSQLWFEIKNSILNLFIFAAMAVFLSYAKGKGWTNIYDNVEDYSWTYLVFSVVLVTILHDTYFYWAHRFMHLPKVYPIVHLTHHKSISPTPWTSFSFHWTEGVMQGLGLFIPMFFIPLHVYAIAAIIVIMTILNVMGHLGYELFPKGATRSKNWGWHNVVTHHDMHHKHFNYNYALYFNWWDKWMNTNHEKYHETFDKIAGAKPEHKANDKDNHPGKKSAQVVRMNPKIKIAS